MPSKRKDGRYQSSVILENPLTGEKVRRYFYAYTLQELEAERRRIMNANILDSLLVEMFHRFADKFLTSPLHLTMDRYVHNTERMQEGVTEKVVKCEEKYGR